MWGSLQCPYYVHKALTTLFSLPAGRVRVVQTETGGGFGGKEEYPSHIAGARRAAGDEIGPARQARVRPRRGHGGHDQAASVTDAAPHGCRRATGGSWRWTSISSWTAARTARCHQSCFRAARCTRLAPTTAPTFAFAAARWPRRRPRMGHFGGSARRRACSRSSGTWTWSRRAQGSRPKIFRRRNFIVQGQMSAIGQVMREPVEMDALLDRALRLSDYHRNARRSIAHNGHSPVKDRASVSRRLCTAPVSRDRAKCTWPRSSTWRPRRRAVCACSPPARKSVRAPTRSLRRSPPTRWGSTTTRSRSHSPTPRTCPNSGPTVASRTCNGGR